MQIAYPPDDLMAFCRTIYGPEYSFILTPQAYPVDMGESIAASAQVVKQVQIQSNADFILFALAYDCNAASQSTVAAGSILITDSSTGDPFTAAPVSPAAFATFAGQPATNLPYPRWLGGNTAVTINFANSAAAVVSDLWITLLGVLVKRVGG